MILYIGIRHSHVSIAVFVTIFRRQLSAPIRTRSQTFRVVDDF